MVPINVLRPPFQFSDHTRSPLTPLTPNACPRYFASMAPPSEAPRRTSEEKRHPPRSAQPLNKLEQARNLRRQIYLNKVRESSENKRWENRSDQILREEYLASQREWENEKATSAPEGPPGPEEESEDVEGATMVDQIPSLEDQELEAFISSMNETKKEADRPDAETHERPVSDYGSDDEEYDRLFTDMMAHPQQGSDQQQGPQENTSMNNQDMDITMG